MPDVQTYFPWQKNEFKVKDASEYCGNVIGNIPLEELITAIFEAGNAKISEINETGRARNEQLSSLAAKYITLWEIVNSVNTAIIDYFDNL